MMPAASAMLYALTVHCRPATETCRSSSMRGSATVTTSASSAHMKNAVEVSRSVQRLIRLPPKRNHWLHVKVAQSATDGCAFRSVPVGDDGARVERALDDHVVPDVQDRYLVVARVHRAEVVELRPVPVRLPG